MATLEQKIFGKSISAEFNNYLVGCGNTLMMTYWSNVTIDLLKDKHYFIAGLSGMLALTSAHTLYTIGKEIIKK